MNRLLIVDDDPKDMLHANDVARSVGFIDIEGKTSCERTVQFLEAAHLGKCLMPDVIIVDLLLGKESGYELLRYCNSKPHLAAIPVVVWTMLGEGQRELCSIFKVKVFLTKWDSDNTLRAALQELRNSWDSTRLK